MKKFIIIFFIAFLPTFFSFSEDFIEKVTPLSYVNWTKGEVVATGTGILKGKEWSNQSKVDAHRAASLDAYRKLIEVIGKINIDSKMKIENVMESDFIRNKVEGVVRNFNEREVRFLKEGICEVDVFIPINGDGTISDIFLSGIDEPKASSFISDNMQKELIKEEPKVIETAANIIPVPDDKALIEDEAKEEKVLLAGTEEAKIDNETKVTLISGLVIDSKNHPVRPALNPKIITENGEEVYGYKKANRDFRRVNGLVSYAASMEDACLDDRVIQTPIVIESLGTPEGEPCIVIIKNEDANKFLTANGSNRVLNHCRVIIVTKPESQEI